MTTGPGLLARVETPRGERTHDLSAGTSIAAPLVPGGVHPRFFVSEPATAEPLQAGTFNGRVDQGASCNAGWVRFAPHCHGTHTEGPGHLGPEAAPVQSSAPPGLLLARLVSVHPVGDRPTETPPQGTAGGLLESAALGDLDDIQALVIRTLPNPVSKCRRDYIADPSFPVLSREAMARIATAGIEHLLIDTPSLDPADDDGALVNHRSFWRMDGRGPAPSRAGCTVTEMVYVPDRLADGEYLLTLGVSAIHGEASPSAPVLFPELRP